MNLKHLSDRALLAETKRFVAKEREISLQLLHHLKEIERRRAFADLGYGSLFEYATKELGYCEASAARRIRAARLLADMPEIESKLESGALNLSHVAKAALLFKHEEIEDKKTKMEVLSRIECQTTKEMEKTLMEYREAIPAPPETFRLITNDMTVVKMNFSNETMVLLEELKDIMAHHRFTNDEMMRSVFKLALEELKKKKFKINANFKALAPSPGVTRYVPATIKKAVYFRDSGKCVKCKSRYKLEYDHVKPFAAGGKSSVDNLRLLCFSCNQRRIRKT